MIGLTPTLIFDLPPLSFYVFFRWTAGRSRSRGAPVLAGTRQAGLRTDDIANGLKACQLQAPGIFTVMSTDLIQAREMTN
jgi:hypothetical protein